MTNTIFLLDFTRGTVEEIDGSTPPRAARVADEHTPAPAGGDGYVLASLGTPPPEDASAED